MEIKIPTLRASLLFLAAMAHSSQALAFEGSPSNPYTHHARATQDNSAFVKMLVIRNTTQDPWTVYVNRTDINTLGMASWPLEFGDVAPQNAGPQGALSGGLIGALASNNQPFYYAIETVNVVGVCATCSINVGGSDVIPMIPYAVNFDVTRGGYWGGVVFGGGYDVARIATNSQFGRWSKLNLDPDNTLVAAGQTKMSNVVANLTTADGVTDTQPLQAAVNVVFNFTEPNIIIPPNVGLACGTSFSLSFGASQQGPNQASSNKLRIALPSNIYGSNCRMASTSSRRRQTSSQTIVLGVPFFQASYAYVDKDGSMYLTQANTSADTRATTMPSWRPFNPAETFWFDNNGISPTASISGTALITPTATATSITNPSVLPSGNGKGSSKSSSVIGPIVGGIVGGVFGGLLLALLSICCYRRIHNKKVYTVDDLTRDGPKMSSDEDFDRFPTNGKLATKTASITHTALPPVEPISARLSVISQMARIGTDAVGVAAPRSPRLAGYERVHDEKDKNTSEAALLSKHTRDDDAEPEPQALPQVSSRSQSQMGRISLISSRSLSSRPGSTSPASGLVRASTSANRSPHVGLATTEGPIAEEQPPSRSPSVPPKDDIGIATTTDTPPPLPPKPASKRRSDRFSVASTVNASPTSAHASASVLNSQAVTAQNSVRGSPTSPVANNSLHGSPSTAAPVGVAAAPFAASAAVPSTSPTSKTSAPRSVPHIARVSRASLVDLPARGTAERSSPVQESPAASPARESVVSRDGVVSPNVVARTSRASLVSRLSSHSSLSRTDSLSRLETSLAHTHSLSRRNSRESIPLRLSRRDSLESFEARRPSSDGLRGAAAMRRDSIEDIELRREGEGALLGDWRGL